LPFFLPTDLTNIVHYNKICRYKLYSDEQNGVTPPSSPQKPPFLPALTTINYLPIFWNLAEKKTKYHLYNKMYYVKRRKYCSILKTMKNFILYIVYKLVWICLNVLHKRPVTKKWQWKYFTNYFMHYKEFSVIKC